MHGNTGAAVAILALLPLALAGCGGPSSPATVSFDDTPTPTAAYYPPDNTVNGGYLDPGYAAPPVIVVAPQHTTHVVVIRPRIVVAPRRVVAVPGGHWVYGTTCRASSGYYTGSGKYRSYHSGTRTCTQSRSWSG